MDDLIAFLRDRLDEDERVALEWQRHQRVLTDEYMNDPRRQHVRLRRSPVTEAQAAKFVYGDRFGPDRALADVAAKRRLLEEFSHYMTGEDGYAEFHMAVRLAALPHAAHEDYKERWRP